MRTPLRCRSNHEWDPAGDFAAGKITGAACPTCGEPPRTEGSAFEEVGWVRGFYLFFGLVFAPVLAIQVATVFLIGPQATGIALVLSVAVIFMLLFLQARSITRAMRSDLQIVAKSMDLTYTPDLAPELRNRLAALPLVDHNPACNYLTGIFRGTAVVVMDVTHPVPWQKGPRVETMVLFPNPILGLPDFTLEPVRAFGDPGHFWNKDLLRLVGLRGPGPLQDKSLGERYVLRDGDSEELGNWLAPEVRDELVAHGRWGIQARQGMLLLYGKARVHHAHGRPTLLALAWELREKLRLAGPAGAQQDHELRR
jgi:hypothetical protein